VLCSLALHHFVRTMICSHIFRHDAPQSCHTTFTIRELQALAEQAGLDNFQINRQQ
jgi:hypothetical protein